MIRLILGAFCLLGALVLMTPPTNAQSLRTWVSGVGDDLNPCGRTAPCKTYAGAISKTAAGGEINCLDPGGFGALTITKSISVICDYTLGAVSSSGTNGFIINAPAGSIVTLKGQDIECAGTGLNGIELVGVGVTLHVHKVQVRNCRGGNGILIAPSSGSAKVFVADSYITDNGATSANAGILVRATGGAIVDVSIQRVQLEANTNGVLADAAGGSGSTDIEVDGSTLTGNKFAGIKVNSGVAAFRTLVSNTAITHNAGTGVVSSGGGSTMQIGASAVTGNTVGVTAISGGTLQSFKNNLIGGNNSDGTPIGGVPLQ